jgi:hypothetical protein
VRAKGGVVTGGDWRLAAFSFRRGPDTWMSFSWAVKVPGTNFESGREVCYIINIALILDSWPDE